MAGAKPSERHSGAEQYLDCGGRPEPPSPRYIDHPAPDETAREDNGNRRRPGGKCGPVKGFIRFVACTEPGPEGCVGQEVCVLAEGAFRSGRAGKLAVEEITDERQSRHPKTQHVLSGGKVRPHQGEGIRQAQRLPVLQ